MLLPFFHFVFSSFDNFFFRLFWVLRWGLFFLSNAFVLGLNSAVVRGCGVMKGEIVEEIRVLGF